MFKIFKFFNNRRKIKEAEIEKFFEEEGINEFLRKKHELECFVELVKSTHKEFMKTTKPFDSDTK
jgi:hypothetical protein